MPDHHHDVPGYIDEVPDLQVAQHLEPALMIVVFGEGDEIERGGDRLVARVARQLDSETPVHIGHEPAAIARVVRVAPAITFAEELESLAQQVRPAER